MNGPLRATGLTTAKGNCTVRANIWIIPLFLCGPAVAADWATRPDDRPFTPEELQQFITTEAVRFYDGGRSEYGPGNSYAYVYANEGRAEGQYRIEADGSVCIDFINGFSRCDLYVRNGDRILMVDQKGDRYPLR